MLKHKCLRPPQDGRTYSSNTRVKAQTCVTICDIWKGYGRNSSGRNSYRWNGFGRTDVEGFHADMAWRIMAKTLPTEMVSAITPMTQMTQNIIKNSQKVIDANFICVGFRPEPFRPEQLRPKHFRP